MTEQTWEGSQSQETKAPKPPEVKYIVLRAPVGQGGCGMYSPPPNLIFFYLILFCEDLSGPFLRHHLRVESRSFWNLSGPGPHRSLVWPDQAAVGGCIPRTGHFKAEMFLFCSLLGARVSPTGIHLSRHIFPPLPRSTCPICGQHQRETNGTVSGSISGSGWKRGIAHHHSVP